MTVRLPVGVLGVGALGQHHARHLAGFNDVRLVGVYDMDRARAMKIARELGTVAFADMDQLLAQVEAVTVAVPTPAHAEVGLRALKRGVVGPIGRKQRLPRSFDGPGTAAEVEEKPGECGTRPVGGLPHGGTALGSDGFEPGGGKLRIEVGIILPFGGS